MVSSRTRDQTHVPRIARWILYHWATREDPWLLFLGKKLWISVKKTTVEICRWGNHSLVLLLLTVLTVSLGSLPVFWVAAHPSFPDSSSLFPLVCDGRRIPITYLDWSVNKGSGPFWALVCHLCRSYKSHPNMDMTEAAGVRMPSHHQSTSPSLSVCTLGTGVGIPTSWGNAKKGDKEKPWQGGGSTSIGIHLWWQIYRVAIKPGDTSQ